MPRRVTIDLTTEASDELDRLRKETGMSVAAIFRHAFTLFRIYEETTSKGGEMRAIGKRGVQTRIVIPR